jgi:hypothetical protein
MEQVSWYYPGVVVENAIFAGYPVERKHVFCHLLQFFIIGCIALLLLTVVVYRTGMVHATRDRQGHLKKRQSVSGILILFVVLLLIISFFVTFGLVTFQNGSSFSKIVLRTALLMLLLVSFDSLIIDLLIIGIIRPSLLQIPSETTLKTMKEHVIKTFTAGLLFIIPIIVISSIIVAFLK